MLHNNNIHLYTDAVPHSIYNTTRSANTGKFARTYFTYFHAHKWIFHNIYMILYLNQLRKNSTYADGVKLELMRRIRSAKLQIYGYKNVF